MAQAADIDEEVEEVVASGEAIRFDRAERGGGGGGGGGGTGGGGGRLEETDRLEVAELRREREWLKPMLAVPRVPG